jgi:hypothetical protein
MEFNMFKNDLEKLDKLTRESSILETELIKKADSKILEVNREYNDVLTNFEVKVSPSQSGILIEFVLSGSEMPDEFFDEIKDRLGASKITRKLFDNNSKMRIAFIFE